MDSLDRFACTVQVDSDFLFSEMERQMEGELHALTDEDLEALADAEDDDLYDDDEEDDADQDTESEWEDIVKKKIRELLGDQLDDPRYTVDPEIIPAAENDEKDSRKGGESPWAAVTFNIWFTRVHLSEHETIRAVLHQSGEFTVIEDDEDLVDDGDDDEDGDEWKDDDQELVSTDWRQSLEDEE